MSLSNIVDKLLNQYGLPDACTTKETNLSTTGVRSEQVNNLDTGLQDLCGGRLVNEGGRVGMNRAKFDALNWAAFIDWFTNDVHNTAQSALSDRNLDGSTSVYNLLPTDETLGAVHSNGSDRVLTKVSSNFEDKTTTVEVLNLKSVEDGWQVLGLELNIHDGTDDRLDVTDGPGSFRRIRARCKTRINASKGVPNGFRRPLTSLLLSSAN